MMGTPNCKPHDPTAEYRRVLEAEPALLAAVETIRDSESTTNDGDALLRDLESFLVRYVVLPTKTALPLALWTIATYLFESFDAFPYLAVSSPVPQCGKTRLLETLELVVSNPRRASNISEAALFRVIEKSKPTLMLDEAETLKGKSERAEYLRQILNAGNRQGAVATRCIGQGASFDVKDFSVFCPKVVCGIGNFPPTIADRSICVPMQRRDTKRDRLERFSQRFTGTAANEGASLQGRARAFASEKHGEIEVLYGKTALEFLGDRDADSWAPLFAILSVADPERLAELRVCAESSTGAKVAEAADESLSLRLLYDLRDVWPESEPYAFSETLKERLHAIEDGPWGESEIKLTARKLAHMLSGFKLHSATVRIGEKTKKGYSREEFAAASAPYLADDPSQASQPA
jgi:hypothetical protein